MSHIYVASLTLDKNLLQWLFLTFYLLVYDQCIEMYLYKLLICNCKSHRYRLATDPCQLHSPRLLQEIMQRAEQNRKEQENNAGLHQIGQITGAFPGSKT